MSDGQNDKYQDVAIPFVQFGNRRALTDAQIENMPWVRDFFEMFRHCFERNECACVWLLIEPER